MEVSISEGAAKEVADLTRDGGNAFLALADTALNLFAPQLRVWAAKNVYRCKDKLDAENAKRITAGRTPIPIRFALPALAKIAEEDNEEMLDLWARLLANLQDPARSLSPSKIYIHVLSEMEPLDASILRHIVVDLTRSQAVWAAAAGDIIGMAGVDSADLAASFGVPPDRLALSLHNLSRLGCLRSLQNEGALAVRTAVPPSVSWLTQRRPWIATAEATFHLTDLGAAVIEACRGGAS